jgi:regulator of nucleoside diphosphate kinase
MTEPDARRLRGLLARAVSNHDQEHLEELKTEIDRAVVLQVDDVPANVVTIHSRARVLDLSSGERQEFTLVLPANANVAARRISVLAPLGTALLGHREGDEVEWVMPGGLRKLRIEQVSRDPESGERPQSVMPQAA